MKTPEIDPLSKKLFSISFLQGIGVGIWTFLSIFILDLGGSGLHVGLLSFVPGLASTLMQMAWGRLGDRIGYSWRTVSVGFMFTSVLSIPVLMSTQPWQLILASSIQALVGSMLEVATTVRFAEVLEPSKRARFMGIYNPLGFAGNITGSFAAGLLIPRIGYRYTFLGYTVMNLLLSLIVIRTLSSPSDSKYNFTRLLSMALSELKTSIKDIPRVFKEGGEYTKWCIGISVRGFGIAMFGPIVTLYLVNVIHASKPEIGFLSSVAYAMRLMGSPPLGVYIDKHGPKRIMIIGFALAFLHPLVLMFAPEVAFLVPVYMLSGIYWAFINSAWFAWQMNLIPKPRGLYAGLLGFINGMSWAIGPLIGGFLGDTVSLGFSAVLSSALILVGLFIIARVPERVN